MSRIGGRVEEPFGNGNERRLGQTMARGHAHGHGACALNSARLGRWGLNSGTGTAPARARDLSSGS
jgi:hypothetical protein